MSGYIKRKTLGFKRKRREKIRGGEGREMKGRKKKRREKKRELIQLK